MPFINEDRRDCHVEALVATRPYYTSYWRVSRPGTVMQIGFMNDAEGVPRFFEYFRKYTGYTMDSLTMSDLAKKVVCSFAMNAEHSLIWDFLINYMDQPAPVDAMSEEPL